MAKYLTYRENGIDKIFNGKIPRYETKIKLIGSGIATTTGVDISTTDSIDDYDLILLWYCNYTWSSTILTIPSLIESNNSLANTGRGLEYTCSFKRITSTKVKATTTNFDMSVKIYGIHF